MQSNYNQWEDEDPYSSGDEIATAQRNTSRMRRSDRNIAIVTEVIHTPPPPWDPQNRSFLSAFATIKDDPAVKTHLSKLEEIKTISKDKELADTMYTEVMAVICHAAKAVSLAGTRWAGTGEREGEETEEEFAARMSARARTMGNFCWTPADHPSTTNTPEEASAVHQPSTTTQGRMDGGSSVGGQSDDYFSLKIRTTRH
jgi:hypothetical protein